MLIYVSIGVGLLTAAILFKIIFEDIECIKYWLQGDFISLLRGEREEYRWDTLKLIVLIVIAAAGGTCAYYQLPKWFPKFLT